MKSLIHFLSELRGMGVNLSLDGERLICNAPKGVVTEEIKRNIGDRKPEILAFLRDSETSRGSTRSVDSLVDLPLSRSQQRLWFLAQLDPENPAYNIALALRLTGNLNQEALEGAMRVLVERHEALRTAFYERNGSPLARIVDAASWSVESYDLAMLLPEESEREAMQISHREARKPFALERAPLIRAILFRLSEERHLLVLVVHHIVADGWSLGILARELGAVYAGIASGKQSSLNKVIFQYRDYVGWEKDVGEKAAEKQLPFWLDRLGGPLPVLRFATNRNPLTTSSNGARVRIDIEPQMATRIQQMCRASAATPFMVLLAAFKVLLSRYTGIEDILIASATANRQKQEVIPLFGFFVNNLVLRTDLSGDPPFRDLLERVKETALSAYAHPDVPFDLLVEKLQPTRSLDHNPLTQVTFNFQNFPMQQITLPGLEVEVEDFDPGFARTDLGVEVWPHEDGYRCYFEYDRDIFEEATIRQMQQHYIHLLESVIAEPASPLSTLSLLSEAERYQILNGWNRTEVPPGPYATVVAWFQAQASKSPQAQAVVMGERTLTYGELDAQSSTLAAFLRALGIGRRAVVGVYVQRSPEMVTALLGILKAGGAYLPLDPALPAQRIDFLLSDASVALILTQSALRNDLADFGVPLLLVDDIEDSAEDAVADEPAAEDLAYLIYTSGSTGNPKGTEIPHRALVNLLASMLNEPGLTSSDTLVSVTTLSFDIASLEIFGPLVCGAKLVLASREQVIDPELLADLLESSAATVMQATPSTWRMLIEAGWMGCANLRAWCGGEALPPDLAESLLARVRELWNLYGPTESTIWSAAHRVKGGEDPVLIGRPIANTRMYILDSYGQPVPIGVPGELYIGGDGVARGYWKRPELTETRFITDPFDSAGRRMYRTGDLARFTRDGEIQLIGRTDHQIKLRGHRIELGEIESALARHPDVLQAVVVLHGEAPAQQLIAYVRQTGGGAETEYLRAWLQAQLPEYMVPSVFIPLEEIPLTPNGKVDRRRLPLPKDSIRERALSPVNPRNQLEERIAEIWSEVLDVHHVSMQDNFFDLGGHSLLLIRVHSKLRQELKIDIPVIDLFRYPTIESLASWVNLRRNEVALTAGVSS
jgi:amino acid adenylation domain-containing protein